MHNVLSDNPLCLVELVVTRFYPAGDKELLPDIFADWFYKRDPTHIIFYCTETFQWLEKNMGFKLVFNNEYDFVVLKKPGPRPEE